MRFAVAVRPLRAMTVIMPLLTTKWPEIVLPFASLKLSFSLIFPLASPVRSHERTTHCAFAAASEGATMSLSLASRMLSYNKYPVAQCETLARIVGNRRIKGGVSNCDTRRRGDDPADMLLGAVPHFYPEGQVAQNVVQVRIGKLPKHCIDTKVRLGGRAP